MRLYENIPNDLLVKINNKLDKIERLKHMLIDTERQYTFLTFLQGLPLTEKQVFDIYTNTKL